MRRALGPVLLVGVFVAAGVGCSVLLDFDKLRNGHDQGVSFGDLAGADLTGVVQDLAGADLTGADLTGALGCTPVVGGPYFENPHEVATPAYPRSLTIVDVDGDHKLDLVIGTDKNLIYVLKNLGGRLFSDGTSFASGCTNGYNRTLLVEDFDGDGVLDIVSGCDDYYSGGVVDELAFLKGSAGGSFAPPVQLTDRAKNPLFGLALDVDQDGKMDAIIGDVAKSGIAIYWGGTAGFATQTPLRVATGFDPWGVASTSLGGDGVPDLAVAIGGGDVGDMAVAHGGVNILRRGRGAGNERTFTLPAGEQVDLGMGEAAGVAFAKLDSDTHPELVVTQFGTTSLFISKGNAMGTGTSYATPSASAAAFSAPRQLAVGDLDCDGLDDAVLTHFQLNADPTDYDRYEIYRGAAGVLNKLSEHDVGTAGAPATDRVHIADLDGDGYQDIIMTLLDTNTGKYRILWGKPTP